MGIEPQVERQIVQPVVVATDVVTILILIIRHLIRHHQIVTEVEVEVLEDPEQKRDGLQLVPLFFTRPKKLELLLPFERMLKNVQTNQICEMYFFVTLGTTEKELLKNYTTF